jgi:hypothetical protein
LGVGLTTTPCKKIIVMNPEMTQASDSIGIQHRQPGTIKELWIGTWNVLILYKGETIRNLDVITQEYRMDTTAVQEIRWIGQGMLERRDCNVYYSRQKSKHEFSCGFVVNKQVKHLVMDFTPIKHRIYS